MNLSSHTLELVAISSCVWFCCLLPSAPISVSTTYHSDLCRRWMRNSKFSLTYVGCCMLVVDLKNAEAIFLPTLKLCAINFSKTFDSFFVLFSFGLQLSRFIRTKGITTSQILWGVRSGRWIWRWNRTECRSLIAVTSWIRFRVPVLRITPNLPNLVNQGLF